MTIQELKAFCAENNIAVEGNKRLKQTWEAAIENWKALQVQAVVIKEETIATAKEATATSEKASAQVESFVVEVVKTLTSEQAIGFYRSVLRMVMLAIVFAVLACMKIGKWCWEHRDRTAVYHWVQDAVKSELGVKTAGVIAGVLVGVESLKVQIEEVGDRAWERWGLTEATVQIQ